MIVDQATRIALAGIRFAIAKSGLPEEKRDRAAIYLLVTGCNVPGATAARVIGTSKQYVWKLLRQIEDERESEEFDQLIAEIETAMFGDQQ